ncbi:MAG TPA: DUF885 domain-containing protein [Candidatus Elarobacter sp.]|nr:DUF885 domain-containing protein [Candidatus Elarobacter sp.]
MLSKRRFVAIVALGALLGVAPAPSPEPSASSAAAADAAYTALAKTYFDENFRANPVGATAAGIHAYDAQLGSYAAADYAAQVARDHRYLDRLAVIDPGTMTPRGGLDRRMLENALRDDLLLNDTMQLWKHQPDGYVQIASGGVFALISRNFAPRDVRLRAVIAREEQIPRLLAQARANLTAVDKDTASIAAEDAAGSVDLFTKTVPQALAGAGDPAARARLRRSTATAVAATTAFGTYLKTRWIAHPSGTYAIGAANYSARLKYEEGIDMPLDRYLAVGEKALAQTHAEMVATAKRIDPHATTEQVLARLYKVHPTSAQLMPAAQADLVKLRAFIIAHHIIDLPPDANIKVTPTPEFLRATTEASMDSPGPLERVAKQAFYNVTPVNPHDPPKIQAQYLEAFNDFERPIISAHEVYPGHFVNFAIDKHLPLTLSEKLLTATSFVEGWAHYDEQMMVDQGWGNGDPRVKIMQLREAIWRNARYVVGVKMHTQGMTVPQAIAFFQTQAFLDPASARAEAKRGTQDATYGYYTLGKLEIFKLRADYEKKLGSAFTLARFHHDLLQYGDPAIPLLRPLLLGADDDGKILPDL